MKLIALLMVMAVPVYADDAPLAVVGEQLDVIILDKGQVAPVDGRLYSNALHIRTAARLAACEAERDTLKPAAMVPVVPLVIVAVLALGAGFAAGYGVAKSVK